MSFTSQSISELATSIHVKDVLSVSLNAQYLNHNFSILKQCLLKLQQLQMNLGHQKDNSKAYSKRLLEVESNIASSKKNHEFNSEKIRQLQNNVGDEFMKRMYGIEEKTKNMFAFEDTVSKLQALNLFVTVQAFNDNEVKRQLEIEQVKKIRDQFERYVPNASFDDFKDKFSVTNAEHEKKQTELQSQLKRLEGVIAKANEEISATSIQAHENSKMIKQINFPDMLEKNRKFREDVDQKMNDLTLKMKRKVGTNELVALEQTMIEKLDKFLSQNQKSKAEKNETKDALLFLEKRIFEIEVLLSQKSTEDDKDPLFSVKKALCASCTKDLGKFQGKLGQYKPWSIFPCRELDPQKIGGFGFNSYMDKVQVKKGSLDDQAFDRLNKTTSERETSPKRGTSTARQSNLISNFGSDERGGTSLKDAYFRQLKTQKGERNAKFFRIKKEGSKPAQEFERFERIKQ